MSPSQLPADGNEELDKVIDHYVKSPPSGKIAEIVLREYRSLAGKSIEAMDSCSLQLNTLVIHGSGNADGPIDQVETISVGRPELAELHTVFCRVLTDALIMAIPILEHTRRDKGNSCMHTCSSEFMSLLENRLKAESINPQLILIPSPCLRVSC